MTVVVDGIDFHCDNVRKGDTVAFYASESRTRYLVALVTDTLTKSRVHLRVFDPNSSGIRKRVDMADSDNLKYKWLPMWAAHELEDKSK